MARQIEMLGTRIRETRRRRGLSAEKLASALRVSGGTITNIETGKTLPSLALLVSIAEYLYIDIVSFFSDASTSDNEAAAAFLREFSANLEEADWAVLTTVAADAVRIGIYAGL